MNVIAWDGLILNVDTENNAEYYSKHTLCNCSACRYFYDTVSGAYPHVEEL